MWSALEAAANQVPTAQDLTGNCEELLKTWPPDLVQSMSSVSGFALVLKNKVLVDALIQSVNCRDQMLIRSDVQVSDEIGKGLRDKVGEVQKLLYEMVHRTASEMKAVLAPTEGSKVNVDMAADFQGMDILKNMITLARAFQVSRLNS